MGDVAWSVVSERLLVHTELALCVFDLSSEFGSKRLLIGFRLAAAVIAAALIAHPDVGKQYACGRCCCQAAGLAKNSDDIN